MRTKNLDKFLKDHKPTCTIHIFSDRDNRRCSCGRDGAIVEKEILAISLEWLQTSFHWFENHDSISVNSQAYKELEEIIKKAQNEKIIPKTQEDS